jgi:general secretion pathway protein D
LGELFGSTVRGTRRTELIVLMTPTVIQNADDSAELLEKLKQDFHGLQPVLPQWREKPANAPAATP